jgi:hypothetical protein
MKFAACVLFTALALLPGCSGGGSSADVQAARRFDAFPLYWLGPRFEKWKLETIDGLDRPGDFVTFIYGTCTPHDGEQPSCTPPLQVQVFPICWHIDSVAEAQIWKRRSVRGAPVGEQDSAPVLFSRAAQVKVYRGEGSDPGLPMRALRALRSLNRVPPVIGSRERIPATSAGVLAGSEPCE